MGTYLVLLRPLACNAADRRRFSLELSLASFFPLGSRNLRGGSAAIFVRFDQAGVTNPGYNGARTRGSDRGYDVDPEQRRSICFPADLDFSRSRRALVFFGCFFPQFRGSRMDACGDHISGATNNVSLHPAKLRCSEVLPLSKTA